MRIRLAFTLDVLRHRTPETAEDEPQTERAPQIDGKGSFVLERSHQDEPDEMRDGYRLGFQPNPETRP